MVTEKALEVSVSPVPLLLQLPEGTPNDGGQAPRWLVPWEPFHGWKPLTSPGAPSDRAGEHEGLGSPILPQVAVSIASGVLPSRGSS